MLKLWLWQTDSLPCLLYKIFISFIHFAESSMSRADIFSYVSGVWHKGTMRCDAICGINMVYMCSCTCHHLIFKASIVRSAVYCCLNQACPVLRVRVWELHGAGISRHVTSGIRVNLGLCWAGKSCKKRWLLGVVGITTQSPKSVEICLFVTYRHVKRS